LVVCAQGRKGRHPAAAKIPEKSHFHGKEERNPVTGRSWMDPPKEKKKENEYCYLPKKWVHTWSGHTKGVNAIRFFPGTGELLHSWICHFPSCLVKRLAASKHILRLCSRPAQTSHAVRPVSVYTAVTALDCDGLSFCCRPFSNTPGCARC
jgi:hypothetical protein